MENVSAALVALLAIGTFPLAAWVGAVLTRPQGPLHGFVTHHFRAAAVGLVILNVGGRLIDNAARSRLGLVIELASTYVLAMMFVPMLRRLQSQTDQALRLSGVKQRPVESESGRRPQGDRG